MTKRFSLIEMIAVIAIIGILMAITLPAFLTMTKGQSVELAAREIGSKLKAVRSYAITNRVKCALVFITSNNDTTDNDRYRFRAYRTCIVTGSTTTGWTFSKWVPDEKWEFLPTGVIIQGISKNNDLVTTSISTRFDGKDDIKSPVDAKVLSNSNALYGTIFKPTGDVEGNDVFYYIGEGDSAGDIRNAANFVAIKVDKYTGRISYYVKDKTE